MPAAADLIIDDLKGFVPFHAISDTRLSHLLSFCSRFYGRKGQLVFDSQQSKDDLLFLMSGTVQGEKTGKIVSPKQETSLNKCADVYERWLALTDCSFFSIKKDILDRFLCWSESVAYIEDDISTQYQYEDQIDWIRTLLASNLFYKVSPLRILNVISHFQAVPVKKDQIIINQGDTGNCCYFIKEGRALVTRHLPESNEKITLAEITVGRCFGEDALIHDAVRNASITMLTDGLLMQMDKRDFVQFLKDPQIDMLPSLDLDVSLQTGSVLIDVRSPEEYAQLRIKGALSMPLSTLSLHSRVLDPQGCYVVYCDTERRSRAAAYFLASKGFRARALSGGLDLLPRDAGFSLLGL